MEGQIFTFWNWSVALYLFVAGVSAGAFAISALAYFLGQEKYQNITRIGAYIAPFPLILGILCLIYDLERPSLFWKLLVTIQAHSVMSLGSWLLLIFSFLSFLYFYLWLPERFELMDLVQRIPQGWEKFKIIRAIKLSPLLRRLRRENLNGIRGWVGLAGIPVSLLVGIYTGVLLGALVARPFWNNPMLPMLFLVSALKTGTASICLVGCFIKGFGGMSREEIETNKFMVHSIDFVLMTLSIIAVLLFIFGLYSSPRSSVEAARLIMGGEFTFLFWGLVVGLGIIFPLALEVYELIPHFIKHVALREHNPWISGAVTASVLFGGFLLRYVVVYAGQMARVIAT
jgi:formate-dependent nitrite reductase membrane component NrfD